MMRIKMIRTAASPDGVYLMGKEYGDGEIDNERAAAFVRAGAATYTDRPQPIGSAAPEAAALEPGENAAMPKPKKRKRGR